MAITAALVKELRERTGAGMMECKKMLVETDGDIDAAIESMRKSGMAKADKKASRIAADGVIAIETADEVTAILEVNCETDFVAKGDDFRDFVAATIKVLLSEQPADVAALNDLPVVPGTTVDERRRELIAKIGENITIRRFDIKTGQVAGYSHGGRIGAIVEVENGNEEVAKDIAMHVAASAPQYVSNDDVPASYVEAERKILTAQAADSGKPAEIIAKMIEGRLRKQLAEMTLYGQPFVKDPDTTVEKLLAKSGTKVLSFTRFAVGEGIEKEESNFVDEVMSQVRGS